MCTVGDQASDITVGSHKEVESRRAKVDGNQTGLEPEPEKKMGLTVGNG